MPHEAGFDQSATPPTSYAAARFGPFELDRAERRLTRNGRNVELPERSLRLLEILVTAEGATVSRGGLLDQVWNGRFVTDTSLTEAVSRLRHALADDPRAPRYIRTVHGRGYRLVEPVTWALSKTTQRPASPDRRSTWTARGVAATIAALATGGLLALALQGDGLPAQKSEDQTAERSSPRYRLAEVSPAGDDFRPYAFPALPLNDLSVDRAHDRVAFSMTHAGRPQIWVYEPGPGELTRLTVDAYSDPVWRPDGLALAVADRRHDTADLALLGTDLGARPVRLLEAPYDQFPESWSADGRTLVYSERHPDTGFDLWILRHGDDGVWRPAPVVRTLAHEAFGAISPDGRHVAYTVLHDRETHVLVADLTIPGESVTVGRDGSRYPFWSPDGDLLHFVRGDDVVALPAAELTTSFPAVPTRTTSVQGVYLAGLAQERERLVVAVLEPPTVAR